MVCKILEGFIHDRIMLFCTAHNLISKSQHGFVHKRGCVTNLLEARDILTEAVDLGWATDVIYTEFAKAFDKVPHRRLLRKLRAYGIQGALTG